jgi:hypothetical protein
MPALAELTNMAGSAIISGYGRDAELEADGIGARLLAPANTDDRAQLGIPPRPRRIHLYRMLHGSMDLDPQFD